MKKSLLVINIEEPKPHFSRYHCEELPHHEIATPRYAGLAMTKKRLSLRVHQRRTKSRLTGSPTIISSDIHDTQNRDNPHLPHRHCEGRSPEAISTEP